MTSATSGIGMENSHVRGAVAEGFEPVREVLAEIAAAEGGGLDAQLAAYHRGTKVVDLQVGTGATADALMGIYSATKGVTHLVVALLVQDGILDLDRPVSQWWPEFAVRGKGELLLRELLSHQAGLVGADGGLAMDELADDRAVAERLGAQRPWWRPGTGSGYHALVMGALSAEVVRRATGRSVQEHFAERLKGPLGLDLHLGLPAAEEDRYLPARPMVLTPERSRQLDAVATAPDSLSGIAFNRHHPGNREVWELPNLRAVRSAGTASFGGISTARDLARLYSALVSGVDGNGPLLHPDTVAMFGQIQTSGFDLVLRQQKAWTVGFHASSELYPALGAGAFGHSGAGGQQALVDPRHELSYAFLRQPFLFPTQADPDHDRLLRALVAGARAVG